MPIPLLFNLNQNRSSQSEDGIEKTPPVEGNSDMDINDREAVIPEPLMDWLIKVRKRQSELEAKGYQINVPSVREALEVMTRMYVTGIPVIDKLQDAHIPGPDGLVPVRIYHPEPARPLPVALFFHGGGHMGGSVGVYDAISRKLALAARRIIVSVEYRLSPEHPYPAGLQDALACTRQVLETLRDLSITHEPKLALIGDSAGAAMSATISHLLQAEPEVILERQVLIYPSLDYTMSRPSMEENGRGYFLELSRIQWMLDAYLKNYKGDRRLMSPLFMEPAARYPQSLVITCGFDPLRDEGFEYVDKLRASGIPTTHLHMSGMIHAYLNLEDLVPAACQRTYAAIGDFLKD